ncbi:hypothetical protein [Brevifollis gellanilyticus]|uniref:Uncharacterized protein n=1 Tax=Brevifollis gellanilyticus TaxID=748831 RepID=A0A512MI31_9BACT|nr:hypothetical protein [Brevifollis gellanilyticus]GEP46394.1 hypothetical protein BGE01nite_56850 [Brevifollis gellanilyticus]
MSISPPWLVVVYTPGFSPIHHRCRAEISLSGHLGQRLEERRVGQWVPVAPEYEAQLEPAQMDMLQQAVAAIDFPRLAARLRPARGASGIAIECHPPGGSLQRVEGSILSYDRGYHDFKQTFEPAQRFWKQVYELLPHPFMKRA